MADEVGAVRFVGPPNTSCGDVLGYEVTSEEGESQGTDATVLQPGDVISGIPAEEVKSFLLNSKFEAADQAAETAGEQLQKEQEEKVAQATLSSGEISAAVLAGIASDEEVEEAQEAAESGEAEKASIQANRTGPRRTRAEAAPENKEATGESSEADAGEENA